MDGIQHGPCPPTLTLRGLQTAFHKFYPIAFIGNSYLVWAPWRQEIACPGWERHAWRQPLATWKQSTSPYTTFGQQSSYMTPQTHSQGANVQRIMNDAADTQPGSRYTTGDQKRKTAHLLNGTNTRLISPTHTHTHTHLSSSYRKRQHTNWTKSNEHQRETPSKQVEKWPRTSPSKP